MRLRPSWLMVAAAVEAAFLVWLANGSSAPAIAPKDAALYEGQGDVTVSGLVADVIPTGSGTRLVLADASARIDAYVPGALHVAKGSWARAVGRIGRVGGNLAVAVEDAEAVTTVPAPAPATVSWPELAAHPEAWSGRAVVVEGRVAQGQLGDGDGHHATLGAGDWPKEGPVRATVSVSYDPACLCHRLDASRVERLASAWTP